MFYKTLSISAVLALIGTAVTHSRMFAAYEDQTAAQKSEQIWTKVLGTKSTSGAWPSTFSKAMLFIESMSPSVEFTSDEFPKGRKKLIHSVGAIAQCEFQWDEAAVSALGYTGLFQKATYGTVRASTALEPDNSKAAKDTDFIPGVGFKFLRTGVPSGNFFAMNQLSTWDSYNWFSKALTNHLSIAHLPLPQTLLAKKFATVSDWASFVGLSDFARFDEDGQEAATPKAPWQLIFQPLEEVAARYTDAFQKPVNDIFVQDFHSGDVLYTIYAIDSPKADGSMTKAEAIGKVVLTSDFVTSKYADETLFLKHQKFEEDLELRPDWVEKCPDLDACAICNHIDECKLSADETILVQY